MISSYCSYSCPFKDVCKNPKRDYSPSTSIYCHERTARIGAKHIDEMIDKLPEARSAEDDELGGAML